MDIGNKEVFYKEAQRILKEIYSKDGTFALNDDSYLHHGGIEAALKLWDKRILDTIPLANDNGSGGIKLETGNGAYTNRLRPESPQLACEKIQQLMMRPVCNYRARIKQIVVDELQGQVREHDSAVFLSRAVASNYERAMDFMLCLDWHLLKNLEVLCLDLTLISPHLRYTAIETSLVEMGRHLNLKTLILLRVSGLPGYREKDEKVKEALVATLEDDGPRDWGVLSPCSRSSRKPYDLVDRFISSTLSRQKIPGRL
jgi:hypothetical protein